MHVHVIRAEGDAKFWLEAEIELARNYGLPRSQLVEHLLTTAFWKETSHVTRQ